MHINFQNKIQIPIELTNSPIQPTILKMFKNLQHVKIPFRKWDNPFYLSTINFNQLEDSLENFARNVGVTIDRELCSQQSYLNYLHKVYEQNYNGDPQYLDFHESIHLCEMHLKFFSKNVNFKNCSSMLIMSYRETAGLLESSFNMEWLKSAVTDLQPGDVFVTWAELGKVPYDYWTNEEPNDINRIKELCKPWITFKPRILVALQEKNKLDELNIDGFNNWWSEYSEDWCRHWQIPEWTVEQQYSVLVFGRIKNLDLLVKLLEEKIDPITIAL